MRFPTKPNEVRNLLEKVAALSRFVLLATDKYFPFFQVLKGRKTFEWDSECERAF